MARKNGAVAVDIESAASTNNTQDEALNNVAQDAAAANLADGDAPQDAMPTETPYSVLDALREAAKAVYNAGPGTAEHGDTTLRSMPGSDGRGLAGVRGNVRVLSDPPEVQAARKLLSSVKGLPNVEERAEALRDALKQYSARTRATVPVLSESALYERAQSMLAQAGL